MSFEKLRKRPVEADTQIIMTNEVFFEDIPAIMEKWSWDGISASSVIFLKEDVENLDEDALKEFVFKNIKQPVDPQTTLSRNGDYVFVNFNFKSS